MSSTERAIRAFKGVKNEEWKTLMGLEKAALGAGTADYGRLSRMGHLPVERVEFAAAELLKKEFAVRRGGGFGLTREGAEALALREYVRKDLVFAIGAIIAKGKESDVYEALTEEGTAHALKFFKIGRTSFTRVRKARASEGAEFRSWLTSNYNAAAREYRALGRLRGLSPAFPRAFAQSRSTVLMQEVSGVRLSQRPPLVDPEETFRSILAAVRVAYMRGGVINGDLSEFNILTNGKDVWLIDWPQAVNSEHPNAGALLDHDVSAVTSFFRRAYGVKAEPDEAKAYVRSN